MSNSDTRGQRMVGADHSTADFTHLADLASSRVGGRAMATNDDFFAAKSNLVKAEPAIFVPGKYTPRGKWMDGWESRRRRTPGHDWCVVELGMRGRVRGVNIDTSFFTGNFPSHASIEAIDAPGALKPSVLKATGAPWTPILQKSALEGNHANLFEIHDGRPWTHLRLNIFPDGGVARLRVYGDVEVDWRPIVRSKRVVDLASIRMGGLVLGVNDMHFGAKDNMIMPGRSKSMADGWETRRRRGPGHDWAIVRLGAPGQIVRIEIDTNHYKGNYPDRASIDACLAPDATLAALESAPWIEMLPASKLGPHRRQTFARELTGRHAIVSHVRLNIFPDGGVSRLRVHGIVAMA